LINHLRESKPKSYTARSLFVNVETYITNDGEIYFG
jgi:hypothetical protein